MLWKTCDKKSIIWAVSHSKPKRKHLKDKPVVDVRSGSYRPTKAKHEDVVKIDADPEELARALTRNVTVRTSTMNRR